MDLIKVSKLMALMLRHKPEKFGLKLDSEGWVSANKLVDAINKTHSNPISLDIIFSIVENCDKKRYAIKGHENNPLIRANQGHSTESIKVTYSPKTPPKYLYHGTNNKVKEKISREGLKKMNRHHVHLSTDILTATKVGKRRGSPSIFVVSAQEMYNDGYKFFLSENDVWLTESVPPKYLFIERET